MVWSWVILHAQPLATPVNVSMFLGGDECDWGLGCQILAIAWRCSFLLCALKVPQYFLRLL